MEQDDVAEEYEIPGADKRRQELREIDAKYGYLYELFGGGFLVGVGVVIGWLLFADKEGYAVNLFTDAISIAVTVFVLDLWTRRRDEARGELRLKADLIAQMGSQVNEEAIRAVEELRRHGWLIDGSLKGLYFPMASLQKARLFKAELQGVCLMQADLQEASLNHTNMQEAKLSYANLQEAKLSYANLQEARLCYANLQDARLLGAMLQGANLNKANLQGAVFDSSDLGWKDKSFFAFPKSMVLSILTFSKETVLPDGSKWTPDTDMCRFTDPTHPNFWRSDDPDSPAYRGCRDSDTNVTN